MFCPEACGEYLETTGQREKVESAVWLWTWQPAPLWLESLALLGPRCSVWAGFCSGATCLPSSPPEALQRYLILIYPGLVGAVTMVSCSILALTHLLFEFKGKSDFLAGLGSPWGRKMPRRVATRQRKEEELEPSPAASHLLCCPARPSHFPAAISHPILRVDRRR